MWPGWQITIRPYQVRDRQRSIIKKALEAILTVLPVLLAIGTGSCVQQSVTITVITRMLLPRAWPDAQAPIVRIPSLIIREWRRP